MKLYLFSFFMLVLSLKSFSQSNYQKFKKLSSPKKWWVIFHPFKAKKTLVISETIQKVTDSIQKTKTLDGDHSGGQVDAFRHAFWMANLRIKIGKAAARSLGKAHEKENYQYYKKKKLEDGSIPDKASMDMDLYNNEIGLSLVKNREKISRKKLIERIISAIEKGEMLMIKKNKKKQFLTCKGNLIKKESLKGKWKNDKCLVKSNGLPYVK